MYEHLPTLVVHLANTGLSRTITTNPWSILLLLAGIAALAIGILSLLQTRTWPKHTPEQEAMVASEPTPMVRAPRKQTEPAPPTKEPARSPRNPNAVDIQLPKVDPRHPDVWAHNEPLQVTISVNASRLRAQPTHCVLLVNQDGYDTTEHQAALQGEHATFTITPPGKGEARLEARLTKDGEVLAENTMSLRFVDYRNEIVETFEDFEKWAHTQYPLPQRSLTAREFIDRYIDLVPGTPIAPLDQIVDLYEMANFSEHPVDRSTYLLLVEAFLELEEAGALEGPQAATPTEAH
jgi:hypothetical protein